MMGRAGPEQGCATSGFLEVEEAAFLFLNNGSPLRWPMPVMLMTSFSDRSNNGMLIREGK